MAGRNNGNNDVDQGAAADIVADNLGLTADDLGANAAEGGLDPSDDDITNDPAPRRGQQEQTYADDDDNLGESRQNRQQQQRPNGNQMRPNGQQQPNNQQQQQPLQTIHPRAEVKADAKGNLVDTQGNIVARAGREARFYQESRKFAGMAHQAKTQVNEVTSKLTRAIEIGNRLVTENEQYKAREAAETALGLAPNERQEAMQLAREAKTDPLGVIKKLLTKAVTNGIDISSLGVAGGGFDAKHFMENISQMIDGKIKPLAEPLQQQQRNQQHQQQVTEEQQKLNTTTQQFFEENPEARKYMNVFQAIYNEPDLQNKPLSEVWLGIQLNLAQQQQQRAQRPSNVNTQQRRPLPNGRGGPMPQHQQQQQGNDGSEMAPVNQSYEQIARELMNMQ